MKKIYDDFNFVSGLSLSYPHGKFSDKLRKGENKILQIELLKKPINFFHKLEFRIKTNLSSDEYVNFMVKDSDSFWTNQPNNQDTILFKNNRLRLGSKKYFVAFDETMQKKAFEDVEFDTAECYIKIEHPKIGAVYSEIFNVKKFDFKKKKRIIKNKNNKNIRKLVNDLKPSSHFFLSLKEKEGLGNNIETNSKGEIIKIYPYNDFSGFATIGYGHLIERKSYDPNNPKHKKWKNGITLSEAERLLYKDVMERTKLIENGLGYDAKTKGIKVKLLQREYDALLMAIFNGGYGDTLENTINKGVENLSKEEIYKAFLTRRFSNRKEVRGLIKRRAMEADIFINDNWMPFPSEKYEDDNQYIEYFQKFLRTGILYILMLFLFVGCKKEEFSPFFEKKEIAENTLKNSEALKESLLRIKIFDDGKGTDDEIIHQFLLEKTSWEKEINNVYIKIFQKLEKKDVALSIIFKENHLNWEKCIEEDFNFRKLFFSNHIYSKEWIFYVYPQMREKYKSKLIEYYEIYEFNED